MRERDLERLRHFYEKAFLKGAYPPWLLELGRNMLDGCDRDAILFAGGNSRAPAPSIPVPVPASEKRAEKKTMQTIGLS